MAHVLQKAPNLIFWSGLPDWTILSTSGCCWLAWCYSRVGRILLLKIFKLSKSEGTDFFDWLILTLVIFYYIFGKIFVIFLVKKNTRYWNINWNLVKKKTNPKTFYILFMRIYALYFRWMLCNVKGETGLVTFCISQIFLI